MAYPLHGKNARVKKNDVDVDFEANWEISAEIDFADKTGKGDNWEAILPGIAKWSGSIDCHFDPTNTEQAAIMAVIVAATPGTQLTDLKFGLDTGDYLSGNLYISSFAVTAPLRDKVSAKFSFRGDGALSKTI